MAGTKTKSLKVIESIRDGAFYWTTDAKVPATMQTALGWEEVEEGVFEVERPKQSEIPAFARKIEDFGFKIKRVEQTVVGSAPSIGDEERSEGETKLKDYLDAKEEAAKAKDYSDEMRDALKGWMIDNGAPKDPAHPEARIAQIGKHKVHNSWVNGRQTPWDDRDHKPVGDWAIEQGCADELVQVVIHRTVTFSDYEAEGIPEGFEGTISIDPDVYDFYVRTGAVPKEIHDAFEARGNGYYGVKVYETKDTSCPDCGSKVAKTAKFCGECGAKQNR